MQEERHEAQEGVSLHTGFPNPANDHTLGTLNLNQLLIDHPISTFLFRIEGNNWESYGIFDGDIAIVDRALSPRSTDLVIWWQDGREGFALSRAKKVPDGSELWGVLTSIIHQFRKGTS